MDPNLQTAYPERLTDSNLRLLELAIPPMHDFLNASVRTSISCTLTTFSLDACPAYECISYALDEPLANRGHVENTALVNGIETAVAPNLAHAMRQRIAAVYAEPYRNESGTAWFWIDAVCINQADFEERTIQVSIMHIIYRNAVNVLVWLGPDPDSEVYQVREFFRAILQQYYQMRGHYNYETGFLNRFQHHSLEGTNLPRFEAAIWRATVRFWDRAYFSRSWVIQEIALAKQAEIWCGPTWFTRQELNEKSYFYSRSQLGITLRALRYGTSMIDRSYEGQMLGFMPMRFQALRNILAGDRSEMSVARMYADRLVGASQANTIGEGRTYMLRSFARQLQACFLSETTDPRDRIFVPLVIMKQIASVYGFPELPLSIDYSMPAAMVYQEATTWVIEESGWLGILALMHERRSLKACIDTGTPSWVVDFTASKPSEPYPIRLREEQPGLSQATALCTSSLGPQIKGSILEVSSKRIGTVTHIGNSYNEMIDDADFNRTADLLLTCPAVISCHGRTRIHWWIDTFLCRESARSCDEEARAAFAHWIRWLTWRKIQRESKAGRLTDATDFFRHQLSLLRLAREDESHTIPDYDFWREILPFPAKQDELFKNKTSDVFIPQIPLVGRRLVLLNNLGAPPCPAAKLLAAVPQAVEMGDEVCLVAGSAAPFLLRPG
nr:hypothetical protein B0A51_07840 [Rachicladosporium sp. CCFEE 5018]